MPIARRLPCLLACALLAACQGQPPGTGHTQTPEEAARHSIELLKAGRLGRFWQDSLPPADYAAWRREWNRATAHRNPPDLLDPARWDAAWRRLAQPDARDALYEQLDGTLEAFGRRYAKRWPMVVDLGKASLQAQVERSGFLGTGQKQQFEQMLDALAPWATETDWFDRDTARRALGIATSAARRLDTGDPDGLRHLDFDGATSVYTAAFHACRQILALYGLSIDQTLDSAHVVALDYRPPYARIRIEYTLQGKPLTLETTMVEQDGRWYDQDLVEAVRAWRRQREAPDDPDTPSLTAQLPEADP